MSAAWSWTRTILRNWPKDSNVFFFSVRRRHTRCSRDWFRRVLFRSPGRADRPVVLHHVSGAEPLLARGLEADAGHDLHVDALRAREDHREAWGGAAVELTRQVRSEERRVGKECRSRWSPYH